MRMYANFINGESIENESVSNINPSDTNDVIGNYARGNEQNVKDAVECAKHAFLLWSKSGLLDRHTVLKKTSEEIINRKEELGKLLAREEGKTLAEGVGEVTRAAQIFDFFAGEVLRLMGESIPSIRPNIHVEITREPLGVVGIITPWNFPIAIPAWKIAPALCYGNTIVFKPAELTPGCAWELVDIINRSGLPKGVLNLVMGKGSVVGQAILENENINAITFTGSIETGKLIANACAKHMRKYQLEMGGKNPLVILDDADLDKAVDCAINGAFFSTGQRCTASSRLIVTEGIYDKFIEAMLEGTKKLVIDNALKEGTHIGPVINDTQLQQDLEYIKVGREEGAKLLFGGERLNRESPGYYFQPALFTECNNNMRICREEIFGPVASVIKVKNYEEALHVANDTTFGLSSGICTSSLKYSTDFKKNSIAGMVMVNLPTAGVDFHVPFGGRKNSSLGSREQGKYASEFYTNIKTSYISH